jgi:isocitrate dehydrogenase
LKKRARLDKNEDLTLFANELEKAVVATIENGIMTKDLALLIHKDNKKYETTIGFIEEVAKTLQGSLKKL